MSLSAIVITKKQIKKIQATLHSVGFANEVIVVIDGEGSDFRDGKYNYYHRPLGNDFASQRNFGLNKSQNEWALFVDDDEIVSGGLKDEILAVVASPKFDGYYLKRLDQYSGQMLKYGETGDIRIIRLAKRGFGKFVRPVHEVWSSSKLTGMLANPLIHQRGELVAPFIARMALYGPIDAKQLRLENKPFSVYRLVLNPIAKFVYNFFLKRGFLDGTLGVFQAYLMSVQSFTVRVFQWQEIG